MSAPGSEMLSELERLAREEGGGSPPPPGGEYIPREEADAAGFDFDPLELTADTLELLLGMAAPNWVADSTPENIRITRVKIEKLSRPYFALLMKYLPYLFEKFPLEMAALMQTVLVLMPLAKAGVPPRVKKTPPEKTPPDKTTAEDASPAAP